MKSPHKQGELTRESDVAILRSGEEPVGQGPRPALFQKIRAVRSYSGRLTLLDLLLQRGLWPKEDDSAAREEVSREPFASPINYLRREISFQMELMADYFRLPFTCCDGNAFAPRIIGITAEYLKDSNFEFVATSYQKYVRARQSASELSFEEIRLSLLSVRLVSLLSVFDHFVKLRGRAASPRPTVSRLLRVLTAVDSTAAEETVAGLTQYDSILRLDALHVYEALDHVTKNSYRGAVETLAAICGCSKQEVAWAAVDLSHRASSTDKSTRSAESHIGYYLVDEGRAHLQRVLSKNSQPSGAIRPNSNKASLNAYIFAMFVLSLFITSAAVTLSGGSAAQPFWQTLLIISWAVVSSDCANRVLDVTLFSIVGSRILPRMNYSGRIPDRCKTVVVVPSMLISREHVAHIANTVEQHHLANTDPNISFVLLTDYLDSDAGPPTLEERELLRHCKEHVKLLNLKYSNGNHDTFYLLHRARRFSKTESRWIGWERKRGKLHALNQLIIYGHNEFADSEGDLGSLRQVRFVVVVDDNTQMTQLAVQELVEIITHPLNQPVVDVARRKVRRGYVILQVLPCVTQESAVKWKFLAPILGTICSRAHPPRKGRNLHFDLFDCCSYLGKGIYDVIAFETALQGRLPEGQVLSHDTLEGGLVKTGFAGDVAFCESCPSTYKAFYQRQHRWIRGDWQNFLLLLGGGLRPKLATEVVKVNAFTKYMVFNFIRRSLVPVARAILLYGIILGSTRFAARGALIYLALSLFPEYLNLLLAAVTRSFWGQFIYFRRAFYVSARRAHIRELILAICAPQQALVMIDAIARTVYRVFRRRNMLAWQAGSYLEAQATTIGVSDILGICSFLISASTFLWIVASNQHSFLRLLIVIILCMNLWFYFLPESQKKARAAATK